MVKKTCWPHGTFNDLKCLNWPFLKDPQNSSNATRDKATNMGLSRHYRSKLWHGCGCFNQESAFFIPLLLPHHYAAGKKELQGSNAQILCSEGKFVLPRDLHSSRAGVSYRVGKGSRKRRKVAGCRERKNFCLICT